MNGPRTASPHEADYVVVGGGSAGCVVAGRLAADPQRTVLLLEFGQRGEENPETLHVDGYKDAFLNDRVMWPKFTVPQPSCRGKSMFVGTGRGLGGSGAINAMVYLRGGAADFRDYAAPSWTWEAVRDDYEGLEAVLRPTARAPTEFTRACIAAAEHAGFRHEPDLDGGNLEGVLGHERMNYRGDERMSAYAAILRPRMGESNLHVETEARVRRFVLEGSKVVAVEYVSRGVERRAIVGREAILCAGAIESPKILMLSGVGPSWELRRHGIPVRIDAPAVGENLQDHPNVVLFHRAATKVDAKYPQLYGFHRANRRSRHLSKDQPDTCYVFYPAHSSLEQMMMRLVPTLVLPTSLREQETPTSLVRQGIRLAFRPRLTRDFVARIYGLVVILGKPKSRGRVRLASASALDPALIDPGYFTHPEDLETLIDGVFLARNIAAAPPLAAFGNQELFPGPRTKSRGQIEAFIRSNAITTYHFGGTCALGTAAHHVVDERLRVRGLENLRVADASVIPVLPVSALNAPSMLVGWRAARFIAEDAVRNG